MIDLASMIFGASMLAGAAGWGFLAGFASGLRRGGDLTDSEDAK